MDSIQLPLSDHVAPCRGITKHQFIENIKLNFKTIVPKWRVDTLT